MLVACKYLHVCQVILLPSTFLKTNLCIILMTLMFINIQITVDLISYEVHAIPCVFEIVIIVCLYPCSSGSNFNSWR